ncbi:MAG: acyl-CoA-binding protein [Bacteriovoracaceae bacterium]|nr:acyl-CoA-binding protein [Bacteriovoracaceae bacterium]
MGIQEDFEKAAFDVTSLSQKPSNEVLLKLYACFKQGSTGDVSGKRPGMLDIKGRAKFDAWNELKGTETESAKQKYIDLVNDLVAQN